MKRSHEEKTSYQLVNTVATLLAVLHVLECATKTVALQLNEAPPLGKRDLIAIALEVVGLELPMFMEVHQDPPPKVTSLLLGTGDGIGANMQPSIA
jgi:hypothetical protein